VRNSWSRSSKTSNVGSVQWTLQNWVCRGFIFHWWRFRSRNEWTVARWKRCVVPKVGKIELTSQPHLRPHYFTIFQNKNCQEWIITFRIIRVLCFAMQCNKLSNKNVRKNVFLPCRFSCRNESSVRYGLNHVTSVACYLVLFTLLSASSESSTTVKVDIRGTADGLSSSDSSAIYKKKWVKLKLFLKIVLVKVEEVMIFKIYLRPCFWSKALTPYSVEAFWKQSAKQKFERLLQGFMIVIRVPRIENRVPRLRENSHRVPESEKIGSLESVKSGPYRSIPGT